MSGISIIHFSPIELYPPIQNLLKFLGEKVDKTVVSVFTTDPEVTIYQFNPPDNCKVYRIGRSGVKTPFFHRYLTYFVFNLYCLFALIIKSPKCILYYETLSAFPVYFYKRFIRRNARVFIHYHEYVSPEEYQNGMVLVKWLHSLEHYLYERAEWVSHTNTYRMELFLKDSQPAKIKSPKILPNYPPLSWYRGHIKKKTRPSQALNVVYVGALSCKTMYVEEFAKWVIAQKESVNWDIYSYSPDAATKGFLDSLNTSNIRVMQGIAYHDLPDVLKQYDVGVILYKGHIPNYVYNAPNKLFEYLACGLFVWFPNVMTGALPYVTLNSPMVKALDFTNLKSLDCSEAGESVYNYNVEYTCEKAFQPLVSEMTRFWN